MYCTRTGRPTACARIAASIAASSASFMPYDPGPGIHVTRTASMGSASISATALRSGYGFWPPAHTCASPLRTSATAHPGAIDACDWNGNS